mgnify:CR=1 FL=1
MDLRSGLEQQLLKTVAGLHWRVSRVHQLHNRPCGLSSTRAHSGVVGRRRSCGLGGRVPAGHLQQANMGRVMSQLAVVGGAVNHKPSLLPVKSLEAAKVIHNQRASFI